MAHRDNSGHDDLTKTNDNECILRQISNDWAMRVGNVGEIPDNWLVKLAIVHNQLISYLTTKKPLQIIVIFIEFSLSYKSPLSGTVGRSIYARSGWWNE